MKKQIFAILITIFIGISSYGSEKSEKLPKVIKASTEKSRTTQTTCINYTTSCGGQYILCCDGCSTLDLIYAAWILDEQLCPPYQLFT